MPTCQRTLRWPVILRIGLSGRPSHSLIAVNLVGGGGGCWASAVTILPSRRATLGVGADPPLDPRVASWLVVSPAGGEGVGSLDCSELARRRPVIPQGRWGRLLECAESHMAQLVWALPTKLLGRIKNVLTLLRAVCGTGTARI
jgi:hypothetical protein